MIKRGLNPARPRGQAFLKGHSSVGAGSGGDAERGRRRDGGGGEARRTTRRLCWRSLSLMRLSRSSAMASCGVVADETRHACHRAREEGISHSKTKECACAHARASLMFRMTSVWPAAGAGTTTRRAGGRSRTISCRCASSCAATAAARSTRACSRAYKHAREGASARRGF